MGALPRASLRPYRIRHIQVAGRSPPQVPALSTLAYLPHCRRHTSALIQPTVGPGVDVAGGKLSAIAFADDVVLLARTPKGLAMQLATYEEQLAKMGLVVNAAKCASLHIRWGGGRGGQKWKCSSGSIFRARDGKEIPALTVSQTYKYLGVQIGAEGTRVLGWPTKYQDWCADLLRAPLKPEQRIYLLRTNIIPKLLHTLSLARATRAS